MRPDVASIPARPPPVSPTAAPATPTPTATTRMVLEMAPDTPEAAHCAQAIPKAPAIMAPVRAPRLRSRRESDVVIIPTSQSTSPP